MTSRSSPIRSSKSARKASIAAGRPRSIPAPQACAVSRQNPTRSGRDVPGRDGLGDRGQLGDARPEPEAAPGRVLEDDHRRIGGLVHLGHDEGEAVGQPPDAGFGARPRDASRRGRSRTGPRTPAPPGARWPGRRPTGRRRRPPDRRDSRDTRHGSRPARCRARSGGRETPVPPAVALPVAARRSGCRRRPGSRRRRSRGPGRPP